MAKKRSRKLSQAIEAFGELPAEVRALGKPTSVHPETGLQRSLCLAGGGFMLLLSVIGLGLYLSNTKLGNKAPEGWLILAGAALVFGAFCLVAGIASGRAVTAAGDKVRGLLLFPDAVVLATDAGFDIIRWDEVAELHAPASKKVWTVAAADGRQIALPNGAADHATAVVSLCRGAEGVLLPRFRATLEAGGKVMFGTFGVSRRVLYYKGDKLAWGDVTELKTVNGRLRIGHGKMMPWCFDYNPLAGPNGFLAVDLLCQLAPPRLLVKADPRVPRW